MARGSEQGQRPLTAGSCEWDGWRRLQDHLKSRQFLRTDLQKPGLTGPREHILAGHGAAGQNDLELRRRLAGPRSYVKKPWRCVTRLAGPRSYVKKPWRCVTRLAGPRSYVKKP